MAFLKKRVLFFLFAALVLGASPALSVPLSSGVENPGAAAYGTPSYTDPDGETTVPVDGTADRVEARIVDHRVAMSSASEEAAPHPEMGIGGQSSTGMGHSTPGWILPAAAVGAGGGALFALMSHDKGDGSSSASAFGTPASLGSSGSGGGITGLGTNNGTPGDNVPEPGTIFLMGAGIAALLSRRRILSM
jgi:hypothetical protein